MSDTFGLIALAKANANSAQISQLTDNGETAAIVVLTQSEYNALTPDANTLYLITEDA
jgi:hypothetical protein